MKPKVMFNKDGFIFRNEMLDLIKLLGMPKAEFIKMMEAGFYDKEMPTTYKEMKTIVNWFDQRGYVEHE